MNKEIAAYESFDTLDQSFPVVFHKCKLLKHTGRDHLYWHWHEKIEFLYFTKGECTVKCNSNEFIVKEGDLVVVNRNELHQARCISEIVEYYCIIVDTSLFRSRHLDVCEAKYINPISQNRILLKNKIENDKEAAKYILEFVKEYELKNVGYEMAIKASIYQLLVFLLRNHVQLVLTPVQYDARMKNLKRLNNILEYIETNYNNKITIDQLCLMAHISRFHFCRLFKDMTGKSCVEYLNELKINNAESMLNDCEMTISEIAVSCGFNDINYFSRLYKKYKKVSPSSVVKLKRSHEK